MSKEKEDEVPFFRRFRLIRVLEEGFRAVLEGLRRMELILENRDKNILNATLAGNEKLEWIRDHVLITERIMATNLPRLKQDMSDVRETVNLLKSDRDALKAGIKSAIDKLDTLIKNAGNSDEADLGTLAEEAESIKSDLQGVHDDVSGATSSLGNAGQAISIAPLNVVVASGGTAKFTASLAADFSATSGTIDTDGNYTAPSDPSITSDTVTATSKGDPNMTASASVTINAAPTP